MQKVKNELRKTARLKRKHIDKKEFLDERIAQKLFNLDEYKNAETVLIYVSLDEEIKTDGIINTALKSGKKVAVPFCKDSFGNMEFYLIKSLSQLKVGSFNVREPDINNCEALNDFSNSIIIVPAMMYDRNGYRLGYGKGYYDRFLSQYEKTAVGLCYDEMIVSEIPRDKYDKSVDIIVTQSNVIKCNNGGRNG